jgi:hypothetical protein
MAKQAGGSSGAAQRAPGIAAIAAIALCALAGCGGDGGASSGPVRCGADEQVVDGACVPSRDTGTLPDATTADVAAPDDTGVGSDTAVPDTGGPDATTTDVPIDTPDGGTETFCEPGFVAGCVDEANLLQCADDGTSFGPSPCPDGLFCLLGECGEQRCEPGRRDCTEDGDAVLECDADGLRWVEVLDCERGLACVRGDCVGGCAVGSKDPSYIGCEFWTVDLPQFQDPGGDPRRVPHSVVVANTSDRDAEITIDSYSDIPPVFDALTVPAGGVQPITFPRADVEDTSRSSRSFRIRTTEPIVAYQFNPLNDVGVASNDASLLLPAEAVGTEYYVMAWPSGPDALGFGAQTGWFTIVATREGDTQVTITFAATLVDGAEPDLQGITAGSTHTFTLAQGDVMNFEALTRFQLFPPLIEEGDVTGSYIVADQPIVVFAGHEEAVIVGSYDSDDESCCADHLEQQLFPISTWGTRYFAIHSPYRGTEVDYWRVLGSVDGTRISTTPSIPGLDGATVNAGSFIEIESDASFEITATAPVLVGQFLVSQQDDRIPSAKGDPAFVLAVPVEQFRNNYTFLTPAGYAEDFVSIVRPVGVEVLLDGTPLGGDRFTALASGTHEWAHIRLDPGAHTMIAPGEERFGIAAYGYDRAVSYGFPGGLDLLTDEDAPDSP